MRELSAKNFNPASVLLGMSQRQSCLIDDNHGILPG